MCTCIACTTTEVEAMISRGIKVITRRTSVPIVFHSNSYWYFHIETRATFYLPESPQPPLYMVAPNFWESVHLLDLSIHLQSLQLFTTSCCNTISTAPFIVINSQVFITQLWLSDVTMKFFFIERHTMDICCCSWPYQWKKMFSSSIYTRWELLSRNRL